MYCQNCGGKIEDNSSFCTLCGSKIIKKPEIKKKIIYIFLILMVCIIFIFLISKKTEKEVMENNQINLDTENMHGKENLLENNTDEVYEKYLCTKKIYWEEDDSIDFYWEYSYDDFGNMCLQRVFDSSGNLGSYEEYIYDDKGNEICYKIYDYDGNMDYYKESIYDLQGRVVKEDSYNAPDFNECISLVTEYNSEGQESRKITYENGEEVSYDLYIYDEKGELTLVESYYYGSKGHWVKYIYDSSIKTAEVYNSSGDINRVYQTIYNLDGSIKEKKTFDENGNLVEQYFYDFGKLKELVTLSSEGEKEKTHIYEYDAKGNLNSESIRYGNGELEKICSYEYELFEVLAY